MTVTKCGVVNIFFEISLLVSGEASNDISKKIEECLRTFMLSFQKRWIKK
jgi:hypothetical protein